MKISRKIVVSMVVVLALLLSLGTTVVMAVAPIPFSYGDVFAAVNNGRVFHYDNAGNFIQQLDTGVAGYNTGMAFDSSGNLYVTNFSAYSVSVFDNGGNLLGTFGSGYSTPESIVFDVAGNAYVGNLGNGIRKYDSSGNFTGTVINTRVDFFDLTADQSTFYYGQEGTVIKTVSNALPGTSGPNFASGLTRVYAMRILGDGGVLVADNVNVKRLDSSGNVTQTYDVTGQNNWFSLNLDPDGTSFWSGDFGTGKFFRFDIAAGTLLDTVDTGLPTRNLYGLTVYGERTAGGPPPPPPDDGIIEVGGNIYPVNKMAILAPWIALIAVIIAGATIAVRRRRPQS